jgi:hypothetical protein
MLTPKVIETSRLSPHRRGTQTSRPRDQRSAAPKTV